MKGYLSLLSSLVLLLSCSTNDDIDVSKEENQSNDKIDDWGVIYREHNIQNPDWIYNVNESEECKKWKVEHEKDFYHTFPGFEGEISEWGVSYPSTKLSEVKREVRKFIRFTKWGKPDGLKYGVDVYTACLGCELYDADYSYEPLKDTGTKEYWNLVVEQVRKIVNNENLSVPEGYEEWVNLHFNDLVIDDISENTFYKKWSFSVYSKNEEEIENQIIQIISWTQLSQILDYKSKSFDTFKVTASIEGSGETVVYRLNNDINY